MDAGTGSLGHPGMLRTQDLHQSLWQLLLQPCIGHSGAAATATSAAAAAMFAMHMCWLSKGTPRIKQQHVRGCPGSSSSSEAAAAAAPDSSSRRQLFQEHTGRRPPNSPMGPTSVGCERGPPGCLHSAAARSGPLAQQHMLLLLLLLHAVLHPAAVQSSQIWPSGVASRGYPEAAATAAAALSCRIKREACASLSSLLLLRGGSAAPVTARCSNTGQSSSSSSSKVRVSIVTATGVGCIDRKWDLLLPAGATIKEVQLALQQLLSPPRPPLLLLRLLHGGRLVSPSETLQLLLQQIGADSAAAAAAAGPAAAETPQQRLSLIWDTPIPPASEGEGADEQEDTANTGAHSASSGSSSNSSSNSTCSEAQMIAAYMAAGDAAGNIAALLQHEADVLAAAAPGRGLGAAGQEQTHQPAAAAGAAAGAAANAAAAAVQRAAFGGSDAPLVSSECLNKAVRALQHKLEPQQQQQQQQQQEHQQQQQTEEDLDFFPRAPRTLGEYVKQQVLLQVQVHPKTLLQVAAGSLLMQQLVSHAAPASQTKTQQRQQRIRELLLVSAAPTLLLLRWRPVLLLQRFAWELLPKGRGWRFLRQLLPPAAAALLEDTQPLPLLQEVHQQQQQLEAEQQQRLQQQLLQGQQQQRKAIK
ncbi:hypothetical protein ACSSS7_007122 [Eimeria intestinalis]